MSKERRRLERHGWLRLESQVFIKRSLFKKEWVPVVPFDFSRYGLGIQTDEVYELKDEVVLSLKLTKKNAVVDIPLISGCVRYKEKHHSRFNYGVEFYFLSENEKKLLNDPLLQIEETLQNFESKLEFKNSSVTSEV